MGWKECLEGQLANGAAVTMGEAGFTVSVFVNRMQFGSAQVAFRDCRGNDVVQGPKDSGQQANPLDFRFGKGACVQGGQCGWIIQLARQNDADPFPDVEVEIVQGGAVRFRHAYVCPTDRIPDSGIEINDMVQF